MSTIVEADLTDVLAKMAEGEFVMVMVVKGGPTQGADQTATYPQDGTPMVAADVQTVLTGFLKQCPIPMDNRANAEGTAWLNSDAEGNQVPLYSSLVWLMTYIRNLVRGQAGAGLRKIEAENATNPMPE